MYRNINIRMIGLTVCCCLLYVLLETSLGNCSIIVTTTGPVRGKLVEVEGFSYYAYTGIPYAESPTGSLRFKPPVPKKPWTEVFDATKEGPVCPQAELFYAKDQMSEDCLTINVLVPASKSMKRRPVYVYVHGAAFVQYSGIINFNLKPELLLKKDIIFVSMNYRLGVLGFLSFGTEEASGNAGLKDVLLALKWLNANIDTFEGSTITVSGISSSSAMIHALLLSEKSIGLFQRAMLISGTAVTSRFFTKYPKTNAEALCRELGISTNDVPAAIQNLTTAKLYDIIEAQTKLSDVYGCVSNLAPFSLSVEIESDHALITQDPIVLIKSGTHNPVPILVGVVANEGLFQLPTLIKNQILSRKELEKCIPINIEYPVDSQAYKSLVNSISTFYFGDTNLKNWTLDNFLDFLSDGEYLYPVDYWISNYVKKKENKPLYYYVFDFDGKLNDIKNQKNITYPGTSHGDDFGYIFASYNDMQNLDSAHFRIIDLYLTIISNFARYGNPTPKQLYPGIIWPVCDENEHHFWLSNNPRVIQHAPFEHRLRFWNFIYQQYYNYLENGGAIEPRYNFWQS